MDKIRPPFHGGENFVGVLFPPEGSRVGVGLCQEAIDRGLKLNDRAEHAAFEAPFGESCEKPLDRVQPTGRCRREVEAPPRVPSQLFLDPRVFVGGVVVDDSVDRLAVRYGGLGHVTTPNPELPHSLQSRKRDPFALLNASL